MIGFLRGKLYSKSSSEILIDVDGVGYIVNVPLSTLQGLPHEGKEIFLYIYTHVREDALQLFGFSSAEEKRLFLTLLGISGIGPKVALSVISGMSFDDFLKAVETEDIDMLTRIPGLGKKTANRIVLELRGKLPEKESPVADKDFDDTLSALVNLGYRKAEAMAALEKARGNGLEGIETLLKESLKYLTGMSDEKDRR